MPNWSWQNQTLAYEPGIEQQARVLDESPYRVDQLPGHAKLAALTGFLDQPGANRHRQRRAQPDANDHSQGHPALAVEKGRPIGLARLVVLDTDTRLGLRLAQYQGIVDDQIHSFGREHPVHQLQQAHGKIGDQACARSISL
jgi:hypothetical protein